MVNSRVDSRHHYNQFSKFSNWPNLKWDKRHDFFSEFPHILYQKAWPSATLIDADFDPLEFQFVMLYPKLNTATVSPFFLYAKAASLRKIYTT